MFQPSEFSGLFRLGPLTNLERCRREIAGCPRPMSAPEAFELCDAYARCDSPSESTRLREKLLQ